MDLNFTIHVLAIAIPLLEFSELEVTGERISASLWRINFNMTAEANGESYTMADQGVYTLDTF